MMQETLWEFAKIGLTAAVTTAGTFVVTWYTLKRSAERDATTRKEEMERNAGLLAVHVVGLLDSFIKSCCDVVGDHGRPDREGYMHHEVETPSISFPAELDWTSISPQLTFRILSLTRRVEYAEQTLVSVLDMVAHPPDYEEFFEARIYQFAEIGLAALALSKELRKAYGIPRSEIGDWDPKRRLGNALNEIKAARKAAQKRSAAEWDQSTKTPEPAKEA